MTVHRDEPEADAWYTRNPHVNLSASTDSVGCIGQTLNCPVYFESDLPKVSPFSCIKTETLYGGHTLVNAMVQYVLLLLYGII